MSDQPPLSAARASVGPAPDYLLLLLGAYGLPILAGINLLWTVFLVFYRIAQLGRQASLLPVFEALFTGVCLSVLLAGVGLGLGALRDHLRRSHRG